MPTVISFRNLPFDFLLVGVLVPLAPLILQLFSVVYSFVELFWSKFAVQLPRVETVADQADETGTLKGRSHVRVFDHMHI